MSTWEQEYRKKVTSLKGAAATIKSGDVVGTGLAVGACSPDMYNAIFERHEELRDVWIIDAVQIRPSKLYDPEYMAGIDGHINYAPGFGTAASRKMGSTRQADFLPCTTSDIADKFSSRADVFIAMVTPPNTQGYVNLGLTNFYTMETIRQGRASGKQRVTIGEVNDQMPTVFGNNWMHISEFDYFVENSKPMPNFGRGEPSEIEKTIAQYVLELINDGDTIQMGIGGIPEAVVSGLKGKKDLGVITEMFPIGLRNLVETGVITNKRKPIHKGVTVATFCMGDQDMYNYVNSNPSCEFYPGSYTNSPLVIAQHPNMVAMNMALMVDLSGQINSEGLGHQQISGTGGQLDFMIGSYWSQGGKGITLLSSARKMKDGSLVSGIVPELPIGSPVTVPRTFAQYVITEYGIANLRNKTRRERAKALIAIAHPDLRGELLANMKKNFFPFASLQNASSVS
ncbi:acetyl-CoA hydrolase/transferase family protein [Desulfosporosinus sp. BICA1-9]|uniref:acetyl-CoA hydrolase/transferase family protein n=1 Tax=Desulfosporosinus sp. BICA1-9 TaxID=1531958 RepID=UPI0005F192A2|nr:acetyl-CoA hydrolase/transferase C-terminal domain-containing protein [Desulfosporosinus sp. BICA1-9]KJS46096.1 MAG: acetyl-CoA hydrolase [Peptococcaceae bacterium BRH_c23]KJS88531.1 MAG: acetyl-CoA hydrolase [Desulfosporosinus sp. BICA1-9]